MGSHKEDIFEEIDNRNQVIKLENGINESLNHNREKTAMS